MTPAFRPFRLRITRQLASVLVMIALLANGFAVVQATPGGMTKDCCAKMMGHDKHVEDCDMAGKPHPASGTDCDDQCMMRCQANNALPSFALALPAVSLPRPVIPAPVSGVRPTTDPDPELRPPIFA